MSKALEDVVAERRRQVDEEGWTSDHDDGFVSGELAFAASCYALVGAHEYREDGIRIEPNPNVEAVSCIQRWWPWDRKWWKPKDKRRNLVKAGALIVAEIERLDRMTGETG